MIDKRVGDLISAVEGVTDGATIMISGFGEVGAPLELVEALLDLGVGDLEIIANNAGVGERGIAALLREGRVRKIICSYPRSSGSIWFEHRYGAGEVELELVPQGTLSERIRAGGCGIPAFYTPTGIDTALGQDKEVKEFGGKPYLLEMALHADVALIKGSHADRWGNVVYRASARNFAPTMAMAGALTVAQVDSVVDLGALSPEVIVTPGVFVDRVVEAP